VFRLGRWSSLLPAGFHVPCGTLDSASSLAISPTGLSPCFGALSNALRLSLMNALCRPQPRPTVVNRFGLFPVRSPLLRKSLFIFSSSGYLDVSVPRVPSAQTMYSSEGNKTLLLLGFPIRTSTDLCLLAAPRSFSQLATSFFGVWCPGILPVLLVA
jgi:hypothetical protein